MTLAERTPTNSPFAALYEASRGTPAPKRKSKAKPVGEVMRRAATRINPYSDAAKRTTADKSDAIRRGGI